MTVTVLERVIPSAPGRPERGGEDHPMRHVTRRVAFDEQGAWTPESASEVTDLFDGLAPEWHTRNDPHRYDPLADAFARGGPLPDGLALELGSGTGLITPELTLRLPNLIALDLSMEMLRLAPSQPPRVRADSSQLPFADGAAAVVVLVNMLLFPTEVGRVLAREGAILWVNTSGDRTPIYLPAQDVVAALPGQWDAVAAEAGWGTWAVVRRAA